MALPLEEPQVNAPRSEPRSPENERLWKERKTQILSDFQSRVSTEFHVPSGLWERTWFWFDIYARYGEAHHVIHHTLYPWIVYKIYDTTETLVNSPGPLWLRRARAAKQAAGEARNIRLALGRLARRSSFVQLGPLEKSLYKMLERVPGPRRKVFREAAANVRSQLGQRDFFVRGLINSGKYLSHMEAEFRANDLPTELTRLPFVESSFNENARSKVGASGVWQIMPATARGQMIVNPMVDERNSPLKATRVAARLLRSYARALGQWPLAVTAYNNGIGNIRLAMRASRSADLASILTRYHRGDFRFASSNFYTCFLAALYAEKYYEILFRNLSRDPVQERAVISLVHSTSARHLPKLVGVSKERLLEYNLDLKTAYAEDANLPRGFKLYVPAGKRDVISRSALGLQPKRGLRRRS